MSYPNPDFVAAEATTAPNGESSITLTIPASAQVGDGLYAFLGVLTTSDVSASFTAPSGWTLVAASSWLVAGQPYGATFYNGAVYTCVLGETPPGTTWSWSSSFAFGGAGIIAAYRGENLGVADVNIGTNATAPDIPVAEDNGLVLRFWSASLLTGETMSWTLPDGVNARAGASETDSSVRAAAVLADEIYVADLSIPSREIVWSPGPGDSYDDANATLVVSGQAFVPEPSYPDAADAGDRLRSRVSEDTGSVLDAVEARVVDASLSVDFTNAVTLEPLTLTNYRDALRATDSATVDATFYPRPVQNTSEEQQFDGITLLSRLASWYPPPIFDTVTNLGIVSSGTATAQQVIQHVLDEWATQADWFTAELAPDLRLRLNGYAPSDYTASDGLVQCETVTIAQDGENRRTARQMLDDLLSPFPSTIVRQNSSGNLEIVPVYGPDADETAHLTLANDDLYSVSQGKPDPWLIKNRATVSCTGYSRQDEVEVLQPAWFQVGSNYQMGKATWYAPPSDRLNLQPPPDGSDTLQESLSFGDFGEQHPALWPISSSNIPAGDGISLRDGASAATITAAWSRYNDTSLEASGSGTLTLIRDDVPFDGVWRDTFRWDEGSQYIIMRARWNAARSGVQLSIAQNFLESTCITGCRGWVVEFTLNDSSVGYATGVRKSATFGIIDDTNPDQSDTLPSSTGNAIDQSQTAFGILEANINIRGYDLDVETLREIATAYVVENITPRVTRDLDVSTWGVGVVFDAIGRLIELPSGESGILTSVEYGDDFTAKSMRRTARVQLKNATGSGALDAESTTYTTTEGGNHYLATTAGQIYKTTG